MPTAMDLTFITHSMSPDSPREQQRADRVESKPTAGVNLARDIGGISALREGASILPAHTTAPSVPCDDLPIKVKSEPVDGPNTWTPSNNARAGPVTPPMEQTETESAANTQQTTSMAADPEVSPSIERKRTSAPAASESAAQEQKPPSSIPTIFPDHYWEPDGVPVFKPTMEQFEDFAAFVRSIDEYGKKAGLVKVIPPAEWKSRFLNMSEAIRKVRVSKPIKQEITGGGLPGGAYFVMNLEQRRTYSVQDWYEVSAKPPKLDASGKAVVTPDRQPKKRMRRTRAQMEADAALAKTASTVVADGETSAEQEATSPTDPLAPNDDMNNVPVCKEENMAEEVVHETPQADVSSSIPSQTHADSQPLENETHRPASVQSTTQAPDERQEAEVKKEGTSTKRKRPKIEEDQPISFDVEEVSSGFSDDYCRELENHYWKSVTYAAPMYGADMLGSIFNNIPGAEQNKWNMAHLDNLLSRVKIPLPGVNEPYLYFGMWKASFAWHVEDMDLYSINYIHFGAPKQWYVIPPDQRHRFETVAKSTFSEEAYKCPEFLRHKTCLISPKFLSRHNVPVSRVVQKAGEFIITYPYGYHQGYNLGFNCAESVNFALDGWVEIGKKAGFCQCIGDSVKLDVAGIFDPPRGPLKIKLKLTAEPSGDQKTNSPCLAGSPSSLPPFVVEIPRKIKKVRRTTKPDKGGRKSGGVADGDPSAPSSRKPAHNGPRCTLCPSVSEAPLLATEVDGVFAHRHCAVFIPETYVQPHPEDSTKEIVMGVASIDPARWRLKCALCKRSSKGSTKIGACIQCAKGKCPRAYHVSCAFDSDICMIPDTDGLGYRCFCPPHDPQKVEKRKAEKEKFMQEAPEKFRPGVTVFAKYDVWWLEGVVESCIASKKSCKVRFPDGFVRTIPWTGLRLTYEETLSRGSSKDNSPAISAAASRQGSVKPQALVIPSVSASLTSVPPRLVPYQAAYRFPPVSQPVLPQPVLPVSTPMLFTTYASGPNGHPAFPHPTYAQPNLYPYYTMPIYPPTMYTLPPLPSSPPRPNTPWYQAHSPANGQRYHSSPPGPDPYGVWRRNT